MLRVVVIAAALAAVAAFTAAPAAPRHSRTLAARTSLSVYKPDGISAADWKKLQEKEKAARNRKDLGKTGVTTFKSRSFDDWQKSGGKYLFAVNPNDVKSRSEIPYMQRRGAADGSDLAPPKEAKKKPAFSFGAKKAAPAAAAPKKAGFSFGNFGKKAPPPPPPAPEKKNWWTN